MAAKLEPVVKFLIVMVVYRCQQPRKLVFMCHRFVILGHTQSGQIANPTELKQGLLQTLLQMDVPAAIQF